VDQKAVVEKAAEIKENAVELAGAGGEAVKEFVSSTGAAAKDFATSTAQAAKELLEATEKAVERMNRKAEPRKKGRRVLKTSLALGVAAGVLANQRARGAITSLMGKRSTQPPWERETPAERVPSTTAP
jgi:hypothetical protein